MNRETENQPSATFKTFSVSAIRERFGENCNLMEAMDMIARERQEAMLATGNLSFNETSAPKKLRVKEEGLVVR